MPTTILEESVLVDRAKQGDRAAAAELVRRYEGRVYRLLIKMLRHPQNAEDALQETFINALKNLNRFKGDSAFGTWLFRIATNQALMLMRKNKRTQERVEGIEKIEDLPAIPPIGVDWSDNPALSVLRKETRSEMDNAIDALPDTYKAVFLLRDVEGLPAAEVAEILGLSVAAVKSRLHRARLTLRESLGNYFAERLTEER